MDARHLPPYAMTDNIENPQDDLPAPYLLKPGNNAFILKLRNRLSPYDGISIGVLASVKNVGYGSADQPFPIISGQDAELPSVKSILAGEQYSTIFKDTRTLAAKAVEMVDAVLTGSEPSINDTTTYENGVKVVPSYLCEPVPIDATNAVQILVTDSGYYTADQLQ